MSITNSTQSTSNSSSTSTTTTNVEEIKSSLLDHNNSFDALLRCIPAKYYIKEDEVILSNTPLTKAQKKAAKKKSQESSVKLAKSEALRKAKLARYDPNEPKTIPEIQAAKLEAAALKKKGKSKATSSNSSNSSSWEDSDEDSDNSDNEGSAPPGSDSEADSPNETDFEDSDEEEIIVPNGLRHPKEYTGEEVGITELREKMKLKIAGMQANKRGRASVLASTNGNGSIEVNGGEGVEGIATTEENLASKEELLESRRKARGLLRDNRRRKRKAERRDEKPKAKNGAKDGERTPSNGRKGGGKANAPIKEPREEFDGEEGDRPRKKSKATPPTIKSAPISTQLTKAIAPTPLPLDLTPSTTPKPTKAPKSTSTAVDTSNISFSTLDFSTTALLAANLNVTGGKSNDKILKAKKNRHALPKDPNAALEVLAKRKERLEALNPEQRERKEEKDRWEKVGLKAEGEKVRDDEKRLKKMAKRQEKIKSKSAKAWAERKETVSSTINAKVAKRNTNMAARAKQVKDKKAGIKVKTKSGNKTTSKSFSSRGKPGFEGSKKKK